MNPLIVLALAGTASPDRWERAFCELWLAANTNQHRVAYPWWRWTTWLAHAIGFQRLRVKLGG